MGEIGRQNAAINDLTGQLTQTREELRALGEAKDALQLETAETLAALAAVQKAFEDESGSHTATRETLAALQAAHAALEHVTHQQRASVAGLETRGASLDLRIVALNHQREELERNLQGKTAEAEVLQVERDLARAERDGLETKRVTLQRRLDEEALRAADLRDQIEVLRRRAEEAERARVAGEQTREAAQQRHDALARKLEEQEKRARAAGSEAAERHEALRSEHATLTGALETARAEIARLQQERRSRQEAKPVASITGQEQSHDGREETALVRQAIADLGADVLKIAEALKTPRSGREDGDAMPPEVVGIQQPRTRARAQS
jgi:chromosome segregation ATPase